METYVFWVLFVVGFITPLTSPDVNGIDGTPILPKVGIYETEAICKRKSEELRADAAKRRVTIVYEKDCIKIETREPGRMPPHEIRLSEGV